jgi:UDP-N-acetylglucosamine--N-acetylmuramyl-(pentapeptide) pyrophosphoryl-undecaprenol N-acetylglucosamine transferase
VLTGNPVRPAIAALAHAPYAAAEDKVNLLVLGGSLGARVFATLVPAALAHLPAELLGRISLTMQCPAASIETAQAALLACGVTANLSPFFKDVAGLMAGSHLVLARSGGSTVAELAVIGRPAVLVPLTINEDQRANADALAAAGGAVRVEQSEGAEALAKELERLLTDPQGLCAMAEAAAAMGIVDAATRLADLVQASIAAEIIA